MEVKIKSMKYEEFNDNEYLEQLRASGTNVVLANHFPNSLFLNEHSYAPHIHADGRLRHQNICQNTGSQFNGRFPYCSKNTYDLGLDGCISHPDRVGMRVLPIPQIWKEVNHGRTHYRTS